MGQLVAFATIVAQQPLTLTSDSTLSRNLARNMILRVSVKCSESYSLQVNTRSAMAVN